MQKRHVVLVVAGVLLAGCARSADGQHPDPAMISNELLSITDMPGNWRETQRQVFTARGPENPSIDPSIWCPAAAEVTKNLVALAGETGADVEMQDLGKTDGYRMMRLQAWSNDDVQEYYGDAKEAVHICDGVNNTDADGVTTSTQIVQGRDIGDESISWAESVTPPPATQKDKMQSVSRTTIARFGGILMVLQLGDGAPTGSAALMDEDAWWSIVESASKKLADLDRQVHD